MFEPLITLFSPHFTVIAPDTPGYGLSDSLRSEPQTLADYLPIKQVWDMANRFFVYFLWFKNEESYRVAAMPPPLNIINTAAMEFLQAGPNYAAAYRAAFDHEKAENLAKVTIPVTLFRWKGAILLKYIDNLIAKGLNDNVTVIETEAAMSARYLGIMERMKSSISCK